MTRLHVLVVDDDVAVGQVLRALLMQDGHRVTTVTSGEQAIARILTDAFDVVISDVRMPGMSGLDLLDEITKRDADLPVLLLTAHGTVQLAVDAMKRGAADFLLKPFDRDELLFLVRKHTTREAGRPPTATSPQNASDVATRSAVMRDALERIDRAAVTPATVLLRGETGTGKEVAARRLHAASARRTGPFVALHCAALPDALLESELFGYEKGAFTGAAQRKPGRVELAEGGTLFLDEIGDISPAVQVKLLRLLQQRTFERLGSNDTLRADVRFVAATHRDLEAMVAEGTFREDLFYRLNVVPVSLPPLRERREDVMALAERFLADAAAAYGRPGLRFEPAARPLLEGHDWPGNVRQLQNLVERWVALSTGDVVRVTDVARELAPRPSASRSAPPPPPPVPGAVPSRPASAAEPAVAQHPPALAQASATLPAPSGAALEAARRDAERVEILRVLQQTANNRTRAARVLGISRRTLYNKLEDLGLA